MSKIARNQPPVGRFFEVPRHFNTSSNKWNIKILKSQVLQPYQQWGPQRSDATDTTWHERISIREFIWTLCVRERRLSTCGVYLYFGQWWQLCNTALRACRWVLQFLGLLCVLRVEVPNQEVQNFGKFSLCSLVPINDLRRTLSGLTQDPLVVQIAGRHSCDFPPLFWKTSKKSGKKQ